MTLTLTSLSISCAVDDIFTVNVSYRISGIGSYLSIGSVSVNPDGTFVTPFDIGGLSGDTCYQFRFTTSGLPYTTCSYTMLVCTPSDTTTTTTTTTSTTTTSTTSTTTTSSTTTTTTENPYTYIYASPYSCGDCSGPSGGLVLVSIFTVLLPLTLGRFYTPATPDGNVYQIVDTTPQAPNTSITITGLSYTNCLSACPD